MNTHTWSNGKATQIIALGRNLVDFNVCIKTEALDDQMANFQTEIIH